MSHSEQVTCELCGKAIGPSGNYELLDGYLCQDCADQLSPWFNEFDMAEVDDLQEQIRLREENQNRIPDFCPSRKFGDEIMVVVDDEAGEFVVTDNQDLWEDNSDIISIDECINCSVDVQKDCVPIGHKRYRYTYNFQVTIDLDHAYLSEITFPLNAHPLEYESEERSFLGMGGFDPSEEEDYAYYVRMGETLENVLMDMEDEDEITDEYDVEEGEFITEGGYESEEDSGNPENTQPGDTVICPWCGCRTRVTGDFHCENCGGNL